MSFVGPRPERPEFVEWLSREIPYYGVRHAVRPGITGWAQIGYKYGNTVEDAREKLQYDLCAAGPGVDDREPAQKLRGDAVGCLDFLANG